MKISICPQTEKHEMQRQVVSGGVCERVTPPQYFTAMCCYVTSYSVSVHFGLLFLAFIALDSDSIALQYHYIRANIKEKGIQFMEIDREILNA
ncbi:MAG: hypothetical protein ACUZ8O_05245 [Candidatus Anammoxibacter sp.]